MIWRRRFAALAAICLLMLPLPALGQQSLRAAAIVNDDVISMLDLEMRIRLAILAVGLENRAEVRQRIGPQVLRSLIDERLQLQEAKRLGIEVSEQDINAAIDDLSRRNNRSRQEFVELLASKGILPATLADQVRATIAWQGVIARSLRPQVIISEDEIQAAVSRIRADQGKRERLIAEIFLAVDDPSQDEDVRVAGERLMQQLRAGARFSELARQFSQGATAPVGGDLGWVQESQLPEEIIYALSSIRPGQVAGPIRSLTGYHLIFYRQERVITAGEEYLGLKQIFIPQAPAGGDASALQAEAQDIRDTLGSCEEMDEMSKEVGGASGDLGEVKVSDLPGNLRNVVANLDIGVPSQPISRPDGIAILMVCSRKGEGINRDEIEAGLRRERIDMLARRHLRDLRKAANVEMRI